MGLITKGMGAILKKVKPKSKSKWIKGGPKKLGSIVGVKPGSGKVPWHVSAGKSLKRRAEIVKTNQRVNTIDAIASAQKKIKEGTSELKKLRTTGWTGKPHGKRGRKHYFPKEEGKAAHMVGKKKPIKKKIKDEDVPF
jgi:hypothetical protein